MLPNLCFLATNSKTEVAAIALLIAFLFSFLLIFSQNIFPTSGGKFFIPPGLFYIGASEENE
jgi:hypothetical protein